MPHIRSFHLFGRTCFIPEFKSIRVLKLKCSEDSNVDLTPICKLFQLRYLYVCGRAQLPAQIRSLQRLETLVLREWIGGDLPLDVVHLPHLACLLFRMYSGLPDGICAMKSLRTLRYFNLSLNSLDNFKGLGELTNIRDLYILCSGTMPPQGIEAVFGPIIARLVNCGLRELVFPRIHAILPFKSYWPTTTAESDYFTVSETKSDLERCEIPGTIITRVPSMIGQLHKLSSLELTIDMLMQDDVVLLAQLPNLDRLCLDVRKSLKERIIIQGGALAFPVLRDFTFFCFAPCVTFMAGVMSNLRGLILDHHERGLECYAALLLKALRTCRTSTMLMFKSSTPSLMVPQVTQKRDV